MNNKIHRRDFLKHTALATAVLTAGTAPGDSGGRLQSYRSREYRCAIRVASSRADIASATARAPGSQAIWLASAASSRPRPPKLTGMRFDACSQTIRKSPAPPG